MVCGARMICRHAINAITNREESRQDEIRQLTSQGKIPVEAELEKHPEKSIAARACTR